MATNLSIDPLFLRTASGNQVRYQANRDGLIYEELASIFRKTAGIADVLRDLLAPLARKISLALVFGSVAQGTVKLTSDIDLLVVGSVTFPEVVEIGRLKTHPPDAGEIGGSRIDLSWHLGVSKSRPQLW